MGHRLTKVRPPLPEVVVDVDRRHAGFRGSALERRQPQGHRLRLADEGLGALESHVVDDVDEEERGAGDGHGARGGEGSMSTDMRIAFAARAGARG